MLASPASVELDTGVFGHEALGRLQTQPNQHVLMLTMPLGSQIMPGQWFAFDYAGTAQFAVAYFTINGVGSAPTLPASLTPNLLIAINILATDLPWSVANKTATAICAAITGGTPSGQGYGFYQTGAATPGVNFGGGPYDGSVAIFSGSYVAVTQGIGTFNSTVAGNLSQGAYEYAVTWRGIDNRGNIDKSGYVAQTVNVYGASGVGGGCGTVLTIPPPRVTNRLAAYQNVTVEIYRSIANAPGAYWRLTSANSPIQYNFASGWVANPNAPINFAAGLGVPVTYTNGLDDLTLQGNSQIYTTGSVAVNSAPPAASIVKQGQGRVVLSGIEGAPTQWWFTSPGNENAVKNFSAFFTGTLPDNNDPIMNVEFMDDYIVFLCANSLYVTAGPGPDATGAGTQFSTPQKIPGNIGCTGVSTVYKDGIAFVSTHGIWLLDRSLQLQPIGSDILPLLAGQNLGSGSVGSSYSIVGAIASPQYQSVLFYGPNGTLAYSYEGEMAGQWSEFTTMEAESMVSWAGPDLTATTILNAGMSWLMYLDTGNNGISSGVLKPLGGTCLLRSLRANRA